MKHPTSRGVFFNNYDLYENPSGPGAGFYQNMQKYKSVSDFLKKKRKKIRKRMGLITAAAKDVNKIDFMLDQYTNSIEETTPEGIAQGNSIGFSIQMPEYDLENKNWFHLDYGKLENTPPNQSKLIDDFDAWIQETNPNALLNQVDPVSDLDTVYKKHTGYSITNHGRESKQLFLE